MNNIIYDRYLITITPCNNSGVNFTIFDKSSNCFIEKNGFYKSLNNDLFELFDYLYTIIQFYEYRKEKKKNDNNV